MNKETQDQIAKIMLLHGTPKQQQEVIDSISISIKVVRNPITDNLNSIEDDDDTNYY